MLNNIWILNHYASDQDGRHCKFAENLIKDNYNVKIFTASTIHNTNKNIINDSRIYVYKEFNSIPYIFIKARNYTGNGIQRILNMVDYAFRVLSVSRSFDTEKPNIIYASSVHPLTWISGYLLAKRYNAKLVAETRDLWPETLVAMNSIKRNSFFAKILYKLEKFIYMKADKLIFTFPGGKDYVKKIGIDISKVYYINNGIDLDEFIYNRENIVYKDKDLDDQSYFKVIYTGSMGVANALIFLIKAAEKIQKSGIQNIKFILFGTGYQKSELEEYVKTNNINNVIFKGKVEKKYIPNILSKSDLNVFTGQHIYLYNYGLSLNKMFEYFASGKPTLSNIECKYDLLEKYKCGLTVSGTIVNSLEDGILEFLNMPRDEYNEYCINASKAARDFDFKFLTDELKKILLFESE